jgi:hypothetical protein
MKARYVLIWRSQYGTEAIDEAETRQEADYLRGEYQLAYGGCVTVKRVLEDEARTVCPAVCDGLNEKEAQS